MQLKTKFILIIFLIGFQVSAQDISCNFFFKQTYELFEYEDVREELKAVESHLMSSFPPDKTQIICFGQSPSAISAYLKSINEDYVQNIPLSKFRPLIVTTSRVTGDSIVINSAFAPNSVFLSENEQQVLFKHFDSFLKIDPAKDIVILDYSSSGATLIGIYFYLNMYFKSKKLNNKIIVYALIGRSYYSLVIQYLGTNLMQMGYFDQANDFTTFLLRSRLIQFVSDQNITAELSEFGAYHLSDSEEKTSVTRAGFLELVDYFRNHH